MTKEEAVAEFKEYVMPGVRDQYERDGIPDWPARTEAWNDFTDMLQKEGRITRKQYNTWRHPEITSPGYRRRNPINWLSRNPFGPRS